MAFCVARRCLIRGWPNYSETAADLVREGGRIAPRQRPNSSEKRTSRMNTFSDSYLAVPKETTKIIRLLGSNPEGMIPRLRRHEAPPQLE